VFRAVLSQYATGVAAVTAVPADGVPAAMIVGSFTSVSLDPPLVGFFPAKSSTSWPRIQEAERFCVNVLGEHQEAVCKVLSSKAPDKLAALSWRPGPSGAPILSGAVAWIDCEIERVDEAGDHYFVLGRVRELDVQALGLPLLFFRGGYGHFRPGIMVSSEPEVTEKLAAVDAVRPYMASLAAELGTTCTAIIRAGRQTVLAAAAGEADSAMLPTPVGSRFPFAPPFGTVFAAWGSPEGFDGWVGPAWADGSAAAHHQYRDLCTKLVERVRERGYALGLGYSTHAKLEQETHLPDDAAKMTGAELAWRTRALRSEIGDYSPSLLAAGRRYEVRHLSAPVLDHDGRAVLELTVWGPAQPITPEEIADRAAVLQATCAAASDTLKSA
jgi:flavin reductase (DIM6/NTAB) family NADH-FMN oxidoreductase RutF